MVRFLVLATFLFPFVSRAGAAEKPPLKTVDHVDLSRYLGKWYELARLPNRFEKKCDRDVMAEYTLDGETVRVVNTCIKADGKATQSKGKAKVVDAATKAKLKVTFFWPFYGDYWIVGLDSEYRWAVVGEPSRKYLWVLSRTKTLSDAEWKVVDGVIREAGYEKSAVRMTKQVP
ncbi:MAG: lipocalin family protein [Acidobacteriaceae bacterium]|nr:lipocalin family protein [Acidobacteriaceae bacterium]